MLKREAGGAMGVRGTESGKDDTLTWSSSFPRVDPSPASFRLTTMGGPGHTIDHYKMVATALVPASILQLMPSSIVEYLTCSARC